MDRALRDTLGTLLKDLNKTRDMVDLGELTADERIGFQEAEEATSQAMAAHEQADQLLRVASAKRILAWHTLKDRRNLPRLATYSFDPTNYHLHIERRYAVEAGIAYSEIEKEEAQVDIEQNGFYPESEGGSLL